MLETLILSFCFSGTYDPACMTLAQAYYKERKLDEYVNRLELKYDQLKYITSFVAVIREKKIIVEVVKNVYLEASQTPNVIYRGSF